ncbi:MAG TPA: biotin--[acetyl-CoA-carboxylase] ligase [Oligoflexia bacterium]|nr:biotin--[acetyl-CoA-carboxylase] ligase [Oligoflexia bacterium]
MNNFYFKKMESCASTNDEAWKIPNTQWPALVSTDSQTNGRGRQGRVWSTAPGLQILATLIFKPALPPEQITWIPVLAGICAHEAIAAIDLGLAERLRLKWPNDLYVGTSKIGGILCESRFQGSELAGVVVGIGLNLASSPRIDRNTTSIAEMLEDSSFQISLHHFRNRFLNSWASLLVAAATPPIDRTYWSQKWNHYARLDSFFELDVRNSPQTMVRARVHELTEEGCLKVRILEGERAGELVFLTQVDS